MLNKVETLLNSICTPCATTSYPVLIILQGRKLDWFDTINSWQIHLAVLNSYGIIGWKKKYYITCLCIFPALCLPSLSLLNSTLQESSFVITKVQVWEQEVKAAVIITAKIFVSLSQAWAFLNEHEQVKLTWNQAH